MKTVAAARDRKRDNRGGADLAAAEQQKVAKQKVAKQRPRLLKGERELERSIVRKQQAAREAERSAARERGRAELVRPPSTGTPD